MPRPFGCTAIAKSADKDVELILNDCGIATGGITTENGKNEEETVLPTIIPGIAYFY